MIRRALWIVILAAWAGCALAATQGFSNCTAANSPANWTSPSAACVSNDSRASYAAATQDKLFVTGYGFTIPTGSTINGIEVTIECQGSSLTTANRGLIIELTKDGSTQATTTGNSFFCPRNVDGTSTLGGAADLWGKTWVVDEINRSTFGVGTWASNTNTSSRAVDALTVRITYTAPNGNRYFVISRLVPSSRP